MDNRPIGVFDSGLGGLTVVKELISMLPGESIVYFGDTARVPYGTRSKETIIKYALQDARFLLSKDVKAIVVACGTVSSVALDCLQGSFDIPVIGVVNPTSKAAAAATVNKKAGIIGTVGTIKAGAFEKELKRQHSEINVVSQACPLFVPLVENGFLSNDAVYYIANEYLSPLKQKGVDTIILGCTHYPLLKGVISDIMGKGATLIDCAVPTAGEVAETLKSLNIMSGSDPQYSFFISDTADEFCEFANMFLSRQVPCADVLQIDIEQY